MNISSRGNVLVWAGLLSLLLLSGCATVSEGEEDKYAHSEKLPANIPVQFQLHDPKPVLIVKVVATEGGYDVTLRRGMGAPSQSIDTDRDVLVTARYADGKTVQTSVFNPREIHTTGAKNPATAVRPRGSFVVSFASPDNIRLIEITTRRGPNQGLKTEVKVPSR